MRRILTAAVCAALLFCIAGVARADSRCPARYGAADDMGGESLPAAVVSPMRDASRTPAPDAAATAVLPASEPNTSFSPVSGTPLPSSTVSALPTASTPASIPASMPIPYVDAQWYIDRNEQLGALLERNGSFQSRDEIDAAIENMYIDPEKPMVALTFDDGPAAG